MGRRRRRVIKVVRRTLPKVFSCPRCGVAAVRVAKKEGGPFSIACGNCGLREEYSPEARGEPIDLYNRFVDKFMSGMVGA